MRSNIVRRRDADRQLIVHTEGEATAAEPNVEDDADPLSARVSLKAKRVGANQAAIVRAAETASDLHDELLQARAGAANYEY